VLVSERVANILEKVEFDLITSRKFGAKGKISFNDKLERLIDMAFSDPGSEEEWCRRWDLRVEVRSGAARFCERNGRD